VQRFTNALLQLFDFILEEQFPALEFGDPQIVSRQMHEGFVQFTFQNAVFPFQLNKMRLNCHA